MKYFDSKNIVVAGSSANIYISNILTWRLSFDPEAKKDVITDEKMAGGAVGLFAILTLLEHSDSKRK